MQVDRNLVFLAELVDAIVVVLLPVMNAVFRSLPGPIQLILRPVAQPISLQDEPRHLHVLL